MPKSRVSLQATVENGISSKCEKLMDNKARQSAILQLNDNFAIFH